MLQCTIKICDTRSRARHDFIASGLAPAVDSLPIRLAAPQTRRETTMKKLLALSVLSLFACAAYAADTTNPQQEKMKVCQAQAGEKKLEGKARQDYVNNCLKAKPAAQADKQKSKMAMCNEKTKGMTKADADKARSECMKAS